MKPWLSENAYAYNILLHNHKFEVLVFWYNIYRGAVLWSFLLCTIHHSWKWYEYATNLSNFKFCREPKSNSLYSPTFEPHVKIFEKFFKSKNLSNMIPLSFQIEFLGILLLLSFKVPLFYIISGLKCCQTISKDQVIHGLIYDLLTGGEKIPDNSSKQIKAYWDLEYVIPRTWEMSMWKEKNIRISLFA